MSGPIGSQADVITSGLGLRIESIMLVLPPTVLFDTNHLIEMTKIRRGDVKHLSRQPAARVDAYRRLLLALQNGEIQPVIGFEQVYEWIQDGPGPGLEIADVLSRASVCYEAPEYLMAIAVEVARQAASIFPSESITAIPPEPLPKRLTDPDPVLAYIRDHAPAIRARWESLVALGERFGLHRAIGDRSFRDPRNMVEIAVKVRAEQVDQDRSASLAFELGFEKSMSQKDREKSNPRDCTIQRLRQCEPIIDLLHGLGLTGGQVDELWIELDLDKCPTLQLFTEVWWRLLAREVSLQPSHQVDITLLSGYCYCNYALVEKEMKGLVVSADKRYLKTVFSAPEDLIDALKETGTL